MASNSKKRKGESLAEIHIPRFTSDWVVPSKTRNAMLNDYILDWLELYGESKGFIPDTKRDNYDPELDFGKYIVEQGIKFEKYIVDILREKFRYDFIHVDMLDNYKRARYTIDLMKKGCPFIYQGMIYNPELKVYGSPDLLVRSDFLNFLVKTRTVSDTQSGCKFSDKWHYRVVDIKFHTLHLKNDFTTICNDDSVRAFKAQCYLYNRCLGYLQDFIPRKAYILGRGWNATSKGTEYVTNDPFNKLGVINYSNEDYSICEDSLLAVQWYSRVRSEGKNWTVFPKPTIPELYPNMNVKSTKWRTVKHEIAHKLEELTLIYNVGYYNRIHAHILGVFKISDENCNAMTLDIKGKKKAATVNGILEAYKKIGGADLSGASAGSFRNKTKPSIDMKSSIEGFFIDIESISSIHNIRDNYDSRVYMIGVGHFDKENRWNYTSFIAKALDEASENKMFSDFAEYIAKFRTNFIYHYNSTDRNELCKIAERIMFNSWADKYVFCDVYNILKNGMFVNGCLNFSLKSVSKSLGINRYDDSVIQSGCESIIWGIRYYEKLKNTSSASAPSELDTCIFINNIKKYNEVDCLALSDVVRFIYTGK